MRKEMSHALMEAFAPSNRLSYPGTAVQSADPAEIPALCGPGTVMEQAAEEEETGGDGICLMSDRGETGTSLNISAPWLLRRPFHPHCKKKLQMPD